MCDSTRNLGIFVIMILCELDTVTSRRNVRFHGMIKGCLNQIVSERYKDTQWHIPSGMGLVNCVIADVTYLQGGDAALL